MTTKFCKIEDVDLNGIDNSTVSLISSFGGTEKGRVLTISSHPKDSFTSTQLTFTRKQVKELAKQLDKWLNGKPLEEVI